MRTDGGPGSPPDLPFSRLWLHLSLGPCVYVSQTPALLFSPSNTQNSSSGYSQDDRPGAEAWAGPGMHLGREFGPG